ncbi:MAG: receptor-mediated endocytosis [Marteilia pararefringens]
MFNTSTEDANLIWNNKTRKELQDHLTTHSQSSSALNLYEVQSFTYKEHSKYLIINGIFIELYNLNPSTQISNPEDFLQKLIDMLLLVEDDDVMKKSMDQNAATSHSHTNTASNDLIDMTTSVTIPSAITVESSAKNEKISKALLNLITNNTSVTIKSREQCESLLKIIQHNIKNAVSVNIIQTLHLIFSTSTALDTLASYYCLGHLISIITTCMNLDSIDTLMQCLIMIEKVIGSTKMLGELFNKGLFIHLIYYFTKPNADFPTRRKILELISFSMKDKLIGPKITIFLPKLIPKIFVFAIEDACESCIGLFDRDHETPEMLWNQEIRQKTFDIMTKLHKSFIKKRNENSHEITLYLPDNFSINLDEMRNKSVTIAGVNLERYLQNPDYVLRKPDEFAISLTHEWSRLMEDLTKINDFSFDQQSSMPPSANPHHEKLELILKCFTNFFKVHSSTLSILPQTDTLGNIIKYSSIYDNEIHSRSAITLMECVAIDENCAKQLISNGCVAIINDILKLKHRMSLSCAIILKNFASQSLSDLANQVILNNWNHYNYLR